MADNLERLPNYTCTQTIERTLRRASKRNYEPLDKLRLEVAFVGGKELIAWPGASKFEEKQIGEVITAGAIGNGNFALHAHNLFATNGPVFSTAVEELREGRKTIRYDFKVPRARSGLHVGTEGKEAVVGYHGAFWVDAETLDLLRLETQADDIPPNLGISANGDVMEYRRTRIGDSDFLLPLSSELVMIALDGNESRNRARFSNCRQYLGESAISFADPSSAPEPATQPRVLKLPAGLLFELNLTSGIDPGKVAIGDPVSATLQKPVRKGSTVLVPRGAAVSGRITRFEKRDSREGPYWVVGLQLDALEAGDLRSDFTGYLEEAGFGAGYDVPFATDPGRAASVWAYLRTRVPGPGPGEGVVFIRANKPAIAPGLRMVWRTVEPASK